MQKPKRKGSNSKEKNLMLSFDSPAMGTRSKRVGGPASPATSTWLTFESEHVNLLGCVYL
jgi:hypothetical protein